MPSIQSNNISLEYQEFGSSKHPAVILIMGLYGQLIDWPKSFCVNLADAGYRVIRFDNRDIGLSERLNQLQPPGNFHYAINALWGLRAPAPYDLDDMALDTMGLMDSLTIDSAHILGFSMGGMIGQILAANHVDRVKSLVCMSSTTGNPWLPAPHWRAFQLVASPSNVFGEGGMEKKRELARLLMSPGYPRSDLELESWLNKRSARSPDCDGLARQLAASLRTGDLSSRLSRIKCPTLVIQGDSDRLVPQACGRDIARKISGAQYQEVEGMGHDLSAALLDKLSESILDHFQNSSKDIRAA